MAAARAVGTRLAERGIGVVYGGSRVGLMGAVADAALRASGEVIGVIPQGLVDRELAHSGLTELRKVATLHERKAVMAELSDAFIALPGGLGTLEELAEVTSWAQLGLHAKPIALLDVGDYWDPLLAWLDGAVETGFLAPAHRGAAGPRHGPRRAAGALRGVVTPPLGRWPALGLLASASASARASGPRRAPGRGQLRLRGSRRGRARATTRSACPPSGPAGDG